MKTIRHFRNLTLAAISLMALGACAGMSKQDKSTAVGAGGGAVGGHPESPHLSIDSRS